MLYLCYLCRFKPLRDHLRGFLIAAWAGDKIAEFSFPEISFHFPLRPWFFFVSPAYAGKSHLRQRPAQGPQDHPPRMRGKAKEEPYRPCHPGITPACAGKRIILCIEHQIHRDHPRMCGEKPKVMNLVLVRPGSPPHVRGKVIDDGRGLEEPGITPACAGKRNSNAEVTQAYEDHPRMCGEKQN